MTSALVVPLTLHGATVGAFAWMRGKDRPPFDERDLTLAGEVGRRAAMGIEHARLYREAQSANRLKDEFVATLSHELRTPLNALLGWTDLLRSGRLSRGAAARGDRRRAPHGAGAGAAHQRPRGRVAGGVGQVPAPAARTWTSAPVVKRHDRDLPAGRRIEGAASHLRRSRRACRASWPIPTACARSSTTWSATP